MKWLHSANTKGVRYLEESVRHSLEQPLDPNARAIFGLCRKCLIGKKAGKNYVGAATDPHHTSTSREFPLIPDTSFTSNILLNNNAVNIKTLARFQSKGLQLPPEGIIQGFNYNLSDLSAVVKVPRTICRQL